MTRTPHQTSPASDLRFAFGQNWMDYARSITPLQIERAMQRLLALLAEADLKGATFLDIGCGSGLHSLAALKLGVGRLLAIDYDPLSVETARSVLARFADQANYEVRQGDILSPADPPDAADIVYSWGVLHHTGDMQQAILNAAKLVNPGGLLVLALYGKTPYCGIWARIKRWYCQADEKARQRAENWYVRLFGAYLLLRGKRLSTHIAAYSNKRGMDFYHDVRDWMGGYPYESITAGELDALLTPLGYVCVRKKVARRSGLFGSGCDEFVYRAP